MLKLPRRCGLAVFASAALALAVALPAHSQSGPQPCGSYLIKDPAGDQAYKQQGNTVFAAPANADIIGVFFRVDAGKVTANLAISDLTTAVPSGFAGIRYRVYATVGDTVRYYEAVMSSSGVAYSYGSDFEGASYTKDGDTTGSITEGKPGVVQIVIPPDAGGKPGTKLSATSGSIGLLTSTQVPPEAQLPPIYFGVDTAPDGAADGPATTPTECASSPSGSPSQPAPPAGGSPPPPSSGPGSPPPSNPGPTGPGTLPASGTLTVEVAADKGKRSTARSRGMRVRVRCSVQCVASAVARIDKKTARKLKLGNKAVTIALGRAEITKPGRIPFFAKLSKKAKKALGRKKVAKFTVQMEVVVTDRQGGQLKRVNKRVTLR